MDLGLERSGLGLNLEDLGLEESGLGLDLGPVVSSFGLDLGLKGSSLGLNLEGSIVLVWILRGLVLV